MAHLLRLPGVRRARADSDGKPAAQWALSSLAGRLSELCGSAADATLTLAARLLVEAQTRGEPVAWVTATSPFFPPDLAAAGIDLAALLVARAPDPPTVLRAADQLLRSGAFGLLVLDVGAHAGLPQPLLARLLGLAQKHDAAIVLLTERSPTTPSLGSLISLRAEARRVPRDTDGDGDGFACELVAVKDKRGAPGWTHREVCRGPAGLR